jgi:hypothetical protein
MLVHGRGELNNRGPARGDCLICTVLYTVHRVTIRPGDGTIRTRESVIDICNHNSFKTVVIVLILLLVS